MNNERTCSMEHGYRLFNATSWALINRVAEKQMTSNERIIEPDKSLYICKPFYWNAVIRCDDAGNESVFELPYPYLRIGVSRRSLLFSNIHMSTLYIEFSGDGQRWMPAMLPHVYAGKPVPCGLAAHPEAHKAKTYIELWEVFQSGTITYVEGCVQRFWRELFSRAPDQDTGHADCKDFRCVIHNATLMEQFSVDEVCEYVNEVYDKYELSKYYIPPSVDEPTQQGAT